MNHPNDSGGDVFLRAFFVFALLISGLVMATSGNNDESGKSSTRKNITGQLLEKLDITRTPKD